ncbi:MAG: potassium/proton antiporter [Actinobacteria bacterium]|nr:potassium/proton antiporter [Actinomycetota bacterium]
MESSFNTILLASSALLLVAVLSVRLASRTGLPSLLIYLAVGLAVGEAGLGVEFSDYGLTAELGLLALALILAEGGLTTRWAVVRPVLPFAIVLATLGVAVSVAVVAGLAHLVLGVDVRTAVILGSVVASTDAAAVFSVLRKLPLKARLGAALEAESGLNDAPVVVLVVLASSDAWGQTSVLAGAGTVLLELAGGAVLGLAVGRLGREVLVRAALSTSGLYPLATVALCLLAFAAGQALHVSGFLAVYLGALLLGNSPLPHRRAVLGFASSTALLAEAGLFVLLGLLASPDRLLSAVPDALLIGAAATFIARPLAVTLSALPFRLPWREQVFLSWAGLRGAVPIVIATIPVTEGVPDAERVLDVVFVLVVVYTLIQAPTLPFLGRRLGVVDGGQPLDVEIETAPLEQIGADLLQVRVGPLSRLHGVYVEELRLPVGAHVTLIVREGRSLVPDQHTHFARGDQLLVVTTGAARQEAEARLRAVARSGKLARWNGELGR